MKRTRPWDKHNRRPNPFSSKTTTTVQASISRTTVTETSSTATTTTTTNNDNPTLPSCITINNIPFYSDRFYLHRTIYDQDKDNPTTTTRNPTNSSDYAHSTHPPPPCHCGVKHTSSSPPPLFDRSALIQSLQLKAVLWSTYTMEPEAWALEYPTLFGKHATIPTLVLHGKKGWTPNTPQHKEDHDDHDSIIREEEEEFLLPDDDDDDDDDGEDSIVTQPPADPICVPIDHPPPYYSFPDTVHFSEITASWIPPPDLARISRIVDETSGCLTPELLAVRKSCKGVHHPKYMLLLENSGALIVVVSTANMTTGRTIDASWMQRFPPRKENNNENTTTTSNDFGLVLAHFMQQQMLSTRAHQITLTAFLQRHVGWKSLRDLLRLYSFEAAHVHLMPVVPGIFPIAVPPPRPQQRQDETKQKRPVVLFGQQRMAHVLQQLTQGTSPWLPSSLLSSQDRLLCQPTSLGAEWTVEHMSRMVQTYLGHSIEQRPQVALLKRLDIHWPTDYYVQQVKAVVHGAASHANTTNLAFSTDDDSSQTSSQLACSGYLFLSSETFNSLPIDCLSQMVLWEPSVPSPQKATLVPHIKSYARVFHGNDYRIRKDYGIPKCEELFSWFLLTSACLSRGAQGVCIDQAWHYANFELGVLFTSRLDPTPEKRLYGWKPSQCVCHTKTKQSTRFIPLPLPYCVRPPRYQEDEEEVEFCETPYFHEVTPSSVAVGNMRLTPYGAAMAEKLAEKER